MQNASESSPTIEARGSESDEIVMIVKQIVVMQTEDARPLILGESKKAGNGNNKQNSSGSKKNKDLKRVRKAINAIIEKFSDEEGWLSSGQLGDQLGKRLPDFDVRNYGYSKLTPFIKSLGSYETGRIPTGSGGRKQIYFRMKEER